MEKDIYTLFIFVDGTRFYFKNDKLHREYGHAIKSSLSSLLNFVDEPEDIDSHLYTKVYLKKNNAAYLRYKLSDNLKIRIKSPLEYMYGSQYHIDGKRYSDEEFKEYRVKKFQEELEQELPQKELNNKKLKL